MEKFKIVVFDFEDVSMIGQAFADQIFRVFNNHYPQVEIKHINANKDVEDMIRRVRG